MNVFFHLTLNSARCFTINMPPRCPASYCLAFHLMAPIFSTAHAIAYPHITPAPKLQEREVLQNILGYSLKSSTCKIASRNCTNEFLIRSASDDTVWCPQVSNSDLVLVVSGTRAKCCPQTAVDDCNIPTECVADNVVGSRSGVVNTW
jgi:hypothetical protein